MAWAAGLFEGEGSVSHTHGGVKHDRTYLKLSIQMTDQDIVRRFHNIVKVGTFVGPYIRRSPNILAASRRHDKPYWIWQAGGRAAIGLMANPLFSMHLGERRRRQLGRVLEMVAAMPPYKPALQSHCKYGHPLVEENLDWVTVNGKRQRHCAECRRRRVRERYRRQRLLAGKTVREGPITHCPQGHEYTAKNSMIDEKGRRRCRICRASQYRAKDARRKLQTRGDRGDQA